MKHLFYLVGLGAITIVSKIIDLLTFFGIALAIYSAALQFEFFSDIYDTAKFTFESFNWIVALIAFSTLVGGVITIKIGEEALEKTMNTCSDEEIQSFNEIEERYQNRYINPRGYMFRMCLGIFLITLLVGLNFLNFISFWVYLSGCVLFIWLTRHKLYSENKSNQYFIYLSYWFAGLFGAFTASMVNFQVDFIDTLVMLLIDLVFFLVAVGTIPDYNDGQYFTKK